MLCVSTSNEYKTLGEIQTNRLGGADHLTAFLLLTPAQAHISSGRQPVAASGQCRNFFLRFK